MAVEFPAKPFRTHGGAAVPHCKNTWDSPSTVMPPPARVILPMSQHIGAPCTPTVKKGDHVYVGQIIGDSDAYISTPIHASVSGTVAEVFPALEQPEEQAAQHRAAKISIRIDSAFFIKSILS